MKDAQTEGKILNEIAKLYLTKDKTEETIDILLKIRKLCQENKIEVDEELSLMRLGQAYEKKGEFNNAIQIMKELNLPVYFMGVGEQVEDLIPFDLTSYIKSLIITEKESINEG